MACEITAEKNKVKTTESSKTVKNYSRFQNLGVKVIKKLEKQEINL